jgi:glycerol uptake facilitator protein
VSFTGGLLRAGPFAGYPGGEDASPALAAHANLAPLIIGFIVVAIGISLGANAGYAINPARDFGPRMSAWAAGWKDIAFPGDYDNVNTYFWIPILGPIAGAGIGAAVYDGLIRSVLRARKAAD